MQNLMQWAIRHRVTFDAMNDLQQVLGMQGGHLMPTSASGESEGAVQAVVRLEAARKGVKLFRNNVGALIDSRGVPVRYGLANDSKKINEVIKSADLIGWRTITIRQSHVGSQIGQFVSRECKEPNWHYSGTEREIAQLAWAQLVLSGGGDACFCTGEGTL